MHGKTLAAFTILHDNDRGLIRSKVCDSSSALTLLQVRTRFSSKLKEEMLWIGRRRVERGADP